jgi:hypothetical protein
MSALLLLVCFGILLLNTYSEHERFAVAFNAKKKSPLLQRLGLLSSG